ncbi:MULTISPECIES: polysaccharide pyruvyl transferase family protein [unclassified Microbacterium]|uniref:polysaccharide pyruvyl transferase family protein n=1 Tax=unclassified Microbacterium TaxID=2609290 RepID=UPI000492FB06|nr:MULTISPECIES: polysaccharide pyruvyl transferase family protein [unclassified Microbacterium]
MKVKTLAARAYQLFHTWTSREKIALSTDRPNAVIMLVPDYGNIGDLAIGYAQEHFTSKLDPGYNVQSIRISRTYRVLRSLKRQLGPDDVVLLVGGGSMGDLYPRAQLGREFVARYLRPHRLVSFPQSIIYMDRPEREKSAQREARALSASSDRLTLFARESESYEIMRAFYPGQVGFAPDVVLSLTEDYQDRDPLDRAGALLALRKDVERALSDADHAVIREAVARFGDITDRDHGIPDDEVDQTAFDRLPLETMETYRRSALVVTDRLHGMIFAAVTGTPCVVLPNTNHKITGTYRDWIADRCAYITLIRKVDQHTMREAIDEVTRPEAAASYRSVRFDFGSLQRAIQGGAVS